LENKNLADQGAVNWVKYQLYNTDSDFYPTLAPCGDRTDFYIKSMWVSGLTLNIQKVGSNAILTWPAVLSNFTLESTGDLGPSANWQPVSPPPTVVGDQNVVTNALTGAQQFYRLKL
jgi:hypothetical protein